MTGKVICDKTDLVAIADAVRSKNGSSNTYYVNELADAVQELDSCVNDAINFDIYGSSESVLTLTGDLGTIHNFACHSSLPGVYTIGTSDDWANSEQTVEINCVVPSLVLFDCNINTICTTSGSIELKQNITLNEYIHFVYYITGVATITLTNNGSTSVPGKT